MNVTPMYLKMCNHPNIQSGHEWEDGDFYSVILRDGSRKIFCWTDTEDEPYDFLSPIFTPRQDQIQSYCYRQTINILEFNGDDVEFIKLLDYFLTFINYEKIYKDITYFSSFEELWLVFYMYKQFNLIWIVEDEQWVYI